MKTAFFALAVILTIIIFSCSDNSVTTTTVASYPLSGKIDNWTYGNLKLIAELYDSMYVNSSMVDSCTISADGSFALNLKAPGNQYLTTINGPILFGCSGSITLNPSNTKCAQLLLSVYDNSQHQFGVISKTNYDSVSTDGSFYCDYLYCDRSVSESGFETCISSQSDTTVFLYEWAGTKSWNKFISLYNKNTSGSQVKLTYTNNEPAGGTWRLHKNPVEVKKYLNN